jgi:centromeric protein E
MCIRRLQVIESRAKGGRDDDVRGKNKATRISTLSLIDLAGSERATDNKERNAEGKHINQS